MQEVFRGTLKDCYIFEMALSLLEQVRLLRLWNEATVSDDRKKMGEIAGYRKKMRCSL